MFYKNKTQRDSAISLFNDKGEKKVDGILKAVLKYANTLSADERKFVPNYSTPYQLCLNYENIKNKLKNK